MRHEGCRHPSLMPHALYLMPHTSCLVPHAPYVIPVQDYYPRMHDKDAESKAPAAVKKIMEALRKHALTYPEATEDFPWGHSAMKVKGKAFAFISLHSDEVSISTKLPNSRDMAADLAFTEPTEYGLGKHGWVTSHLRP